MEVVALGEVPNGPTVDLKIETQIPSKVRGPQNEQTPARLGLSGSNQNRENQSED